ncbi:MAG: glycosyltransferase family 4 protein [Bacillota bacterium]|nr:glycosyltransferase family 4 protein [Bacillota bacterium]
MKRYRIILVGPSLKTQGGISSVIRTYLASFQKDVKITFIPTYFGRNRAIDILFFVIAIFRITLNCITRPGAIFHINSSYYGSFLRKSILANICFVFRKKVLFHIHAGEFNLFIDAASDRKKRSIIKLLNRVNKVIILSESFKSYFSRYVKSEKLEVIYNPCPFVAEQYTKRSNNKLKLLFVGRIWHDKGAYDLLEAIKLIDSKDLTVQLFGDGEVKKFTDLVKAEGLDDIIKVNPWVSQKELLKLYDSSDLLVLPSYAEGLPMSVLEAMGRGLPVIATVVGGIPEAVSDGQNGYLIKPGDTLDLKTKIEIFLNNPELCTQMGKKSLEIAKEKFSIPVIKKKLLLTYEELL